MSQSACKTLKAFGFFAIIGAVLTGAAMSSVAVASANSAGASSASGQAQLQLLPQVPPCAPGYVPNVAGKGCHAAVPPAPSGPIDCSSITIENQQPASPNPIDSATCFFTAYQTCNPANLAIQFSPDGPGGQHSLSLASSSNGCLVIDAATPTTDGMPSGSTINSSCASLQLSTTQLAISSCSGAPSITVPL